MSEEEDSLYSEQAARDVQTIMLMRIYDVLISQFMVEHAEEAEKLYYLHLNGGFLNPPPAYDPENFIK